MFATGFIYPRTRDKTEMAIHGKKKEKGEEKEEM